MRTYVYIHICMYTQIYLHIHLFMYCGKLLDFKLFLLVLLFLRCFLVLTVEDSPLGTLVHNDLKVENILIRFVTTSRGRQPQAGSLDGLRFIS